MTEAWILSFVLTMTRVASFWMMLPIWSAVQVPKMVKLGLIIALTSFWVSGMQQPAPATVAWASGSLHWIYLVVVVVREMVFGGMLGMAFVVLFIPAKIAGAYIGQELGLSMATLTDATSGAADNIVATLTSVFAITLFFALNLHHYFVHLLNASLFVVPVGEPWQFGKVGTMIHGLGMVTGMGLEIAAPIAIVSLVTMFALLLLARTAPSLNLFSVGIPVRLLVGLAAILLFLPSIISSLLHQFKAGLGFLETLLL